MRVEKSIKCRMNIKAKLAKAALTIFKFIFD